MSALLQDLLRQSTISDSFQGKDNRELDGSDDDELVGVVSLPGTPTRTRPSSPSPQTPRRAAMAVSNLSLNKDRKKSDPLRALPTEVSQKIFSLLPVRDLARCSLVCKKWGRSQTLNYVWFRHYRKDNFHDASLPPGKWTKRESKVNWRSTHISTLRQAPSSGYSTPSSYYSPSGDGYQTPREAKEAQWRAEADVARPGKNDMRDMYKQLDGRKVKGKGAIGKGDRRGVKDKAGVGWD